MIPWKNGRSAVWDVTCVDTLAASHTGETARMMGAAATKAEGLKSVKYRALEANYVVIPFAVETFGAFGPSAEKLVQELGKRVQESTHEPRSTSFLVQALSMAIQRGNAISILGTIPSGKGLDEVYDL